MRKFPFKILLSWYKKHGRHTLPWRQYFHLAKKDLGYHVWLSEIILQQTQADRCIAYYQRILEKFPNIESLAQASYEEFFPYYKGLGYYSRARNMLKAAQKVMHDF
jgi:A/G-specific adenine glycosylase